LSTSSTLNVRMGTSSGITLLKTIVIGAVNWDINLFVRKFPKKGEEVVVSRITRVPGGKAGNVAVAAARLLGPDQAAILGGLGKDSIASEQVRIFQEEGVVTSGLKFTPETESGQAYIVIDEKGNNIIHTHLGANAAITPEDLDDPTRQQLISEAAVITIMDPPFETALKLARSSRRLNKTVAWDPGVKSELGVKGVRELLQSVDYVVANESECKNLTGVKNPTQAAKKLIKTNAKLKVITKLGSKGATLHYGRKRIFSDCLDLRSRRLRVVNTVGCGDAFLGAFVAALSEGRSNEEALRWGNCAGGLKATRPETRGSPDRETLLKYLE
jgi:ribokinase